MKTLKGELKQLKSQNDKLQAQVTEEQDRVKQLEQSLADNASKPKVAPGGSRQNSKQKLTNPSVGADSNGSQQHSVKHQNSNKQDSGKGLPTGERAGSEVSGGSKILLNAPRANTPKEANAALAKPSKGHGVEIQTQTEMQMKDVLDARTSPMLGRMTNQSIGARSNNVTPAQSAMQQ